MDTLRSTIDKALGHFLVGLMVLMTLDVLWGVATRYILGSQADWSEELARFFLVWIGILGAAYASGKNMHLAIDLLMPRLTEKQQRRLLIFIHILVMVFAFLVMVVGGLRLLYITHTLGQLSAALRLPMTVVYAVLPISGLLVIFYKLESLLRPNRSASTEL